MSVSDGADSGDQVPESEEQTVDSDQATAIDSDESSAGSDADAAGSDAADGDDKPRLQLEVEVKEVSTCERHVVVSISREDIDRYYKNAFDELKPKAEIPGFRPGRAPRKLFESKFRERVGDQVKGSLLMDSMTQISTEHDFSAISEPDFDLEAVTIPDEGPLRFEFKLEVRPEFDMPEWSGLKLNRPVREYSEEDVDKAMQKVLARYAEVTPVEGKIEKDDILSVNITFSRGDKTLSKIEDEEVRAVNSLSFSDGTIDGFADSVVGAELDAKCVLKAKLTEELDDEELRGAEVDAEVEILDIKRVKLPQLDRAFLDKLGGFEGESELREVVKEELERQFTYHQQRSIREQITKALTAGADWDLPPALLRRQASRELDRAVMELQAAGFSQDVIRNHQNQLRQNSLATTRTALQEHFILEKLAEEEEIDASNDDFDAELALIAMQSGESPRRVRARMDKKGQLDTLRNQIVERKVIELITSQAEFTETEYDPEDDNTFAVDHPICGKVAGSNIPEAKHGGEAEPLRQPVDHT